MALLQIIQDVAGLLSLTRPLVAAESTEIGARQLLAHANVEGRELARRHPWEALVREAVFTTVAAEDQGAVVDLAPGFAFFLNGTQWNRTQQRRLGGPLSPSQWQGQKARVATGPYQDFRVRGGRLLMVPAPPAGETAAFEYLTRNWIGDNVADRFQADTDEPVLDPHLIMLGIVWRWLAAKGHDYAEAFRTYERAVHDAIGRDGGAPVLDMAGRGGGGPRGVRAPDGSWSP